MVARSLLRAGNQERLRDVMLRARNGEPTTIAFLGGSITAGGAATSAATRYANRTVHWWQAHFPSSPVELVNAGVGGTGSIYGALRTRDDVIAAGADVAVVEFAVNDGPGQFTVAALEGLVRQLLYDPDGIAVILLFTVRSDGSSAQEWHAKVGDHYDLPMISYGDAVLPEIEAGTLAWDDVAVDGSHPNDLGHQYLARFLTALFDSVEASLPAGDRFPVSSPIPPPLFTDAYERTLLLRAGDLEPTFLDGWSYDETHDAWTADVPGSVLETEVTGEIAITIHHARNGPMGRASVHLDEDAAVRILEGWTHNEGIYLRAQALPRSALGLHRLRFELLEERAPQSTGHEFRLAGIGVAGRPRPYCGDAVDDDRITATDALPVLRAAVGQTTDCPPWICDANGDGMRTATDGLIVLKHAVGQEVALQCQPAQGLIVALAGASALRELHLLVDFSPHGAALDGADAGASCTPLLEGAEYDFTTQGPRTFEVRIDFASDIHTASPLLHCALQNTVDLLPGQIAATILDARDGLGAVAWTTAVSVQPW